MSLQPKRLAEGGLIDRDRELRFRFDGRTYAGYQGDTLASALLANGVVLVGRSFKYHRPRGVFSAGPEETNALVQLREGARQEPNTLATMTELYDGLIAESQNRSFSLRWDPSRINDWFGNFLPAGFYYKTFMGPFRNTAMWMWFEAFIRRAAGLGAMSGLPDPDYYDSMSRHCEVLVIGSGPTGLAAACSAAASGARVILVEERAGLGGQLRREHYVIDGKPAMEWVDAQSAALRSADNVEVMTRTTAFGYYDHNMVSCVERVCDHLREPVGHKPRQRLWNIRAVQVVLATGAIEQPVVFANNDRPNIMLAAAARAYANEYGVLPGAKVVVFTASDDAYRTAIDLADAGAEIVAVVDSRAQASAYAGELGRRNIRILQGHALVDAEGNHNGVRAVLAMPVDGGATIRLVCDLVAMSNGWAPALHLLGQSGGKTEWDAERSMFVPGESKQAERSAGAAKGTCNLGGCLAEGVRAGAEAAADAGYAEVAIPVPQIEEVDETLCRPLWEAPDSPVGHAKKFVDHQGDVGASDIALAHREGYVSVEHLKRFTTLGMQTEQGKTANVAGLAIMAAARGCSIPEAGHTTFRPPYTPVSLGVLGGPEIGEHFMPLRRTAMDSWHDEHESAWIDAGIWRRPRYYPKSRESMFDSFMRETRATRASVGVCDVTTLGKIDLQGPDTTDFLELIYTNHWRKLAIGKVRYGLMLREDGLIYDDGTTSRLGEQHYLMTTQTANAVLVMTNLEYYLQVVWPRLRVQVTSVTEQWSAMAVAGPNARNVLQKLIDIDLSNAAFPFMAAGECVAAGVPRCRLFRISFSGELAYELNVPCDYGRHVWEQVMAAGEEFGVVPYGTETLGNLRIEKGHVAGPELDGRTTAEDLGLGKLMSQRKEFIGKRLAYRTCLTADDREKFAGFVPIDGKTSMKQGAQIIAEPGQRPPIEMIGHITSTGYCAELDHPIALGLIRGGLEAWDGKTVYMSFPLRNLTVPIRVVSPVFVDPQGERVHA